MNSKKSIAASLCLLIVFTCSYSYSANDSINPKTDSTAVFYYHNNLDSIFIPRLIHIDTCLNGVQKYQPLRKWHNYYASLGNNGLAYDKMLFSPTLSTGFDYGLHAFDKFLFSIKNTPYYKNTIPYTDVFYVMGRNREHFLHLKHNQNIKRNLTVGLNFRLINSPGFYAAQQSNNSNVLLYSKYTLPNKKYSVLASFIHNGLKIEENGGIENDSAFDFNLETNRRIIEVNLNEANRKIKETTLYVRNAYDFFKISSTNTDNDTTAEKSVIKKPLLDPGNIFHTFTFNRKSFIYKDRNPAGGFYPVIYFDSLLTYDSTAIITFENKLGWSNFSEHKNENFLNAAFDVTIRNIKLRNDSAEYMINQFALSAKAAKSLFKKMIIFLNGEYVFGDQNNGDHYLNGRINWNFGKDTVNEKLLSFNIEYSNKKPEWIYKHYYSNNFIWNNDPGREQIFKSEFCLRMKSLIVKLKYYNINSYLIFNETALPDQSSETINVITASVFKKFVFGKLHLDNEIVYQYDGRTDVLHLPDLILNHSIYVNLELFKRAARIQTGLDIFYNTEYYSNAYMPATGIFYLQNEKKTGNYPYADIFVNLKIKRAMLFAKYEHINKGLFDYNYYMTPHYPMPDGAFKFGIKWRFYN